jgi:Holliday junction resolvase YEN1
LLQAPGDTEAELADLNHLGYIDAVITNDGDAFAFGALTIVTMCVPPHLSDPFADSLYASPNAKDNGDFLSVFTAEAIYGHLGLSRGGMILLALLVGGDLNPVRQSTPSEAITSCSLQSGLHGCGHSTALALTQSGLGDPLFEAAQHMSYSDLSMFLPRWRQSLCDELRSDASGKIGRKHPKLTADVPGNFPSMDLVLAYVRPLTSWSSGGCDMSFLTLKEPRLDLLIAFCHQNFSWGSSDDVQAKLDKILSGGICLKMLCMVHTSFLSCPFSNLCPRALFAHRFS